MTTIKENLLRINSTQLQTSFKPSIHLKNIEKAVSVQLIKYSEMTGMTKPLQSVYKTNHSTETSLLKIKTDLLDVINRKEVIGLVLLDLSAMFDMISHRLLLNRLCYCNDIQDVTLEWIKN